MTAQNDPLCPDFFALWILRWVVPRAKTSERIAAVLDDLGEAGQGGNMEGILAEASMLYGEEAAVQLFVALSRDGRRRREEG